MRHPFRWNFEARKFSPLVPLPRMSNDDAHMRRPLIVMNYCVTDSIASRVQYTYLRCVAVVVVFGSRIPRSRLSSGSPTEPSAHEFLTYPYMTYDKMYKSVYTCQARVFQCISSLAISPESVFSRCSAIMFVWNVYDLGSDTSLSLASQLRRALVI